MKRVVTSENNPIRLWLEDVDEGTMTQARNLANLPFIFKHIALMPDAHLGYGMPIGGVMATDGVIIPNAVGVDIGCGMVAVKTSLASISHASLKQIMTGIRKAIPLGFKHHRHAQDEELMPRLRHGTLLKGLPVISSQYRNARSQLGTLGGGNHFLEIQQGSDGHVWLMIHSGSRILGFKVANYYNRLAGELNRKWGSKISPKWQLSFLPLDSEAGINYQLEMNYCVEFALANRQLMMDRLQEVLHSTVSGPVFFEPGINIAHNYAAMENHFGQDVMVHRKGATRAMSGEFGIIPGSQGTPSYIVKGLGEENSFMSCSHGAGRKMSRRQARRRLDLGFEQKKLDQREIIHAIRHRDDLDEASGAYKDINQVIDNQLDLVEVVVELKPLAVIKG